MASSWERLKPAHWRDEFVEACAQPIADRKEDESASLESGGLVALVQPWSYNRKLQAALLAEFIGMTIFQIYGGNAPDSVAAFGNGITLVVLVYATANISGGHLNPAVSLAQALTGHMSWERCGLYAIAQVLGGVFGALIQAMIMPGISVGHGDNGPGCFTPTHEPAVSNGQLFGWEMIMTFTLVSVVYTTAVAKPGHGSLAPLAIGFTLFASAFVGGPYSGAALNPARVIGPSMVFGCYWSTVPVYIIAQLIGAAGAAALTMPLYGFGRWIKGNRAVDIEAGQQEGGSHPASSLLPKDAARSSDVIQMTAIASSYDPTPARKPAGGGVGKSVSFREGADPQPQSRQSNLPPLHQTAGFAAASGGSSGMRQGAAGAGKTAMTTPRSGDVQHNNWHFPADAMVLFGLPSRQCRSQSVGESCTMSLSSLRTFLRSTSGGDRSEPASSLSSSLPASPSFSDFSMGARQDLEDCTPTADQSAPNPFAHFTSMHRGSLDTALSSQRPVSPPPTGRPSDGSLWGRLSMDSATSRPAEHSGRPNLAAASIPYPGASPSFHRQHSRAVNIPQLRPAATAPVDADFVQTAPGHDAMEDSQRRRSSGPREGKIDGMDYYGWCELLRSSSL